MPRFHLFELTDQRWCPQVVRQLVTDYLATLINLLRAHHPLVPVISSAVTRLSEDRIVDLCSGSGGSLIELRAHIQAEVRRDFQVILTDLFPNHDVVAELESTQEQEIQYQTEPVDARDVPSQLTGLRTMFDSFHHFKPEEAREILQNVVDQGTGFVSVEVTERSLRGIIPVLFAPVTVLLLTPWIRPFRWWRLALTYLLPLASLVILWDGVVSCFRTYTQRELWAMIATLENAEHYHWAYEKRSAFGAPLTWLVGLPEDPGP